MKHLALVLLVLPLAIAGAQSSQWHHLHLTATDTAAAAAWYVDLFGGNAVKFGTLDVALSGGTSIAFYKRDTVEPSEGSSVDHIGFSVENMDAAMKTYAEKGVAIVAEPKPLPGGMHYAFIQDPWGTKIEIIDDPEIKGFHHVHLHSPKAQETIAWYKDVFGGEITTFAGIAALPSIKYGNMWLIVQQSDTQKAPTDGRAVDHLGFSFPKLDETVAGLKAKSVKVLADVVRSPMITYAFIEAPDGVKIEIVEAAAATQ